MLSGLRESFWFVRNPNRLLKKAQAISIVILNPSPRVILSEAKNLAVWLRINSLKNLGFPGLWDPSLCSG
jgi:hypothetical protein